VANEYSSSVSRIDAARGAVVHTAPVDGRPTSLLSSAGRIWVGTRRVEPHAGGTLRLLHTRPLSIDPAVNIDLGPFQSDGFTRDTLVTFNHAPGAQGLLLVPDLALTLPMPTNGGRTYTFRLRAGIRYSTGELVRAADFRRALERLFRLQTPPAAFITGIGGSRACRRNRCDLSRSIVADEAAHTVTIHLTAPDANFLEKLTGPWTSPVPAGTPWHVVRATPIPGTGPYRIAHATAREIRYVRNPYFREWSHAAQPAGQPDVIVMRFGLDPAREVREVESGRADWTADGVPAELIREVTTRFTSQLHTTAGSETQFLQLNATLPPFDDVRVRRALNYAIDRNVVVRLWGGPAVATATCQVLPPGVLGFRRYCPYTKRPRANGRWSGPDLATARRLVRASGTSGDEVIVWGSFEDFAVQHKVLPYVVSVLRRLGFRARAHLVPSSYFQHAGPRAFRRIQMTPPDWADNTAYNFFAPWLACDAALNHHWFCDRTLDRAIGDAQNLESSDPRAAAARWAAVDRTVVDRAAWVPLVNPRTFDFLSAEVGSYQHHPVLGLIADQLTVR
jgi:peptide/nickel transport system substrate-binding protein